MYNYAWLGVTLYSLLIKYLHCHEKFNPVQTVWASPKSGGKQTWTSASLHWRKLSLWIGNSFRQECGLPLFSAMFLVSTLIATGISFLCEGRIFPSFMLFISHTTFLFLILTDLTKYMLLLSLDNVTRLKTVAQW